MIRTRNILIIILVLFAFKTNAQRSYETNPDKKRANIWYFGQNAGINFNTNPPTALTNGKVNTIEGCASMCDTSGNLLFYTDGQTIWNKNHDTLIGGTGINMEASATQGATIVPYPNNDSLFYLFTLGQPAFNDLPFVSLINIKSNKVIYKNKLLFNETTEKLSVTKHRNNLWFWVSFKGLEDSFYNFLVTDYGIILTPYITKSIIKETIIGGGAMKFSPDGKKLAICNRAYSLTLQDIELCDFNNESGGLSNNKRITNVQVPYGIDFSPNSKYIFTTESSIKLIQFDISSNNISAINASRNVLADISKYDQIEGLQLASDGNIYMAGHDSLYIGKISNTNSFSPSFIARGLYLGGKKSDYGMPNFVQSYFFTPSIDFEYHYNCVDNTIAFQGRDTFKANSHSWIVKKAFGSSTPQLATSKNHTCLFMDTGIYEVKYIAGNGSRNDTVQKRITIIPKVSNVFLGRDTEFCANQPFNINLNAPANMHDYQWSNGSNQTGININKVGVYSVIVTVKSICQVLDTIIVKSLPVPSKPVISQNQDSLIIQTNADTILWYKDNIFLSKTTKQKLTISSKGKYYTLAKSVNGCSIYSDTFTVTRLTNIKPLNDLELLNIYPNPVSDEIFVDGLNSSLHYNITISDQTGKNTLSLVGVEHAANFSIPVTNLSNGIYIIQIIDNNHNQTIRKIIKQ